MFTKDDYDGDDGIGSPRNEKCQYNDKKVQGCLALLLFFGVGGWGDGGVLFGLQRYNFKSQNEYHHC